MEYDNGGLISGPKLVTNNTGRPIPVYPRMQEGKTVVRDRSKERRDPMTPRDPYDVLFEALDGFCDRLQIELLNADKQKQAAEGIIRQLFPDISEAESKRRLREFDAEAAVRAVTLTRLRRLLEDIDDKRERGELR